MSKSTTLTLAEQTHIAQFTIDNPDWTDIDYASQLGCSPAQVRYAREKARAGKLKVRKRGLSEAERTKLNVQEMEAHELMARQCHVALAQLEQDDRMEVGDRVALLGTIARTHRTVQEVRLQGHLKATDAEVIINIIRRFLPDATEEACIQIYYEERERWQATRQ